MRTTVITLTKGGRELGCKISQELENCSECPVSGGLAEKIRWAWQQSDGIICIMAAGIVVRSIAPLCKDKRQDPCIVVLDEKGRFVISLLSGHLGGGNALARDIARITGGQAVITTASDVTGHTALDLWIADNDLIAENPERLTAVSALLVNEGAVTVYSDQRLDGLPADFCRVKKKDRTDIVISPVYQKTYKGLWLIPRNLFVGFGCNRGTTSAEFGQALDGICSGHGIDCRAIAGLASIDVKSDEQGLLDFAEEKRLPLRFFTKDELNAKAISSSKAVLAATGAKAVAEPAAILAAGFENDPGRLIVRKMKWKNVTAAVAARKIQLRG